ncbi:MAG: bifunctional ornithine acetyltransferase/N-acetylglutamate synthase, partial [Candidatus Binatia bacterium]
VTDGDGATNLIEVHVHGARSGRDAQRVADTVARSPLCKTAFFGGDPHTGRIVCAAGYSGAEFDPRRLDVYFDAVQVVRRGQEIAGAVIHRAAAIMRQPEFTLTIDLHAGSAAVHRLMSDLSLDYVRFNSAYRT